MKTREQLEATGNKILNSVRTELYLSMRFMGPALGSLGFAMDLSTRTVGTDAVYIRFNPTYLLQTYIERPEILNRTYMHMLMHCLFRHMFSAKQHEDAQSLSAYGLALYSSSYNKKKRKGQNIVEYFLRYCSGIGGGFHGLSDHFACDFGFPAGVV